jgi:hypothetical protein
MCAMFEKAACAALQPLYVHLILLCRWPQGTCEGMKSYSDMSTDSAVFYTVACTGGYSWQRTMQTRSLATAQHTST